MKSWRLGRTPFAAVFRNEVLLASKRAAPYVMAPFFVGNAVLWWGWGPGVHYGWAANSDFTLSRLYGGFTFLTLPLFTAVLMGDPVIRDFRAGVTPLLFSKPVGRAQYLLGKFLGNFFVLVCCQSVFALTLCLLQAVPFEGMVKGPPRFAPYLIHFLMIVVVPHLLLAAVFFAAGTLTQSARLVYVLAVSFYPLYAAYQITLRAVLPGWRVRLDLMLFDRLGREVWTRDAAFINALKIGYPADILANRAVTVLAAGALLWLVYARFGRAEREGRESSVQTLGLATRAEVLYNDSAVASSAAGDSVAEAEMRGRAAAPELPAVKIAGAGLVENLGKLWAALVVELRLLAAERGLLVLLPLAAFFSVLEVVFYEVRPEVSYSGAYASRTCAGLMLFVCGLVVFYTGEALHRDRELRVEPVLWAAPAPDHVLLLSKFGATLALTLALVLFVGLTASAAQLVRGHTPFEPSAYLLVYGLILLPTAVFVAGAATAVGVLLRDKYVAHAACIALGIGLFYLYGIGHNQPLYNPALYGLWTYAELREPPAWLILHRAGCLLAAVVLLSLALAAFPRKGRRLRHRAPG